MRNLLPLLWALLIFYILGSTYWYVCKYRGLCGTAKSAVSADQRASKLYSHPLEIRDGSFSAKANDNIRFGENSAAPIIPDPVSRALTETVGFASKSKKAIALTGYYMDGESAELGKQRAERVKAELIRLGGDRDNITTSGKKGRGLAKSMGQIHGAIGLSLSKAKSITSNIANAGSAVTSTVTETVNSVKESATDAVETVKEAAGNFAKPEIRKKLAAKNLNLYFESGSTNVIMTSEIRDYFDNLKVYLDANPTAKVRLIGHTDNEGSAASNLRYGRQRAERIRAKLMKGGIKGSQIVTESKGQLAPIATNETEDGRKKNRRVEITIN